MANTENIEAKLAAYVDGELDAAGRAEIEQYLTTNPQHRQLIDELRQAKNYLQELPRAAAPVEVAEMISQQLERAALLGDVDIGGGGSTHFSRWPQLRAIAAILVLTVGLAGVLYYVLPSPKPMSPQSAIITPDLPTDESTARAVARPSGPELAEVDARERIVRGAEATAAAPTMNDRDNARTLANAGRMAGGGAGAGGGGGNFAAPGGALYLMVNTPDPATANTQLVNFFASNRISYEQIAANDVGKKEADQPTLAEHRAPLTATTLPEFDNVAPVAVSPSNAGNVSPTGDPQKDSEPTTHPADKLELAKNLSADAVPKQQATFACYKAKMTREEATNLSETLSQPQLRQVAQIMSPETRQQQQQIQTKSDADDEVTRREKSLADQEQKQGQASAPTTNESVPTTDQNAQALPAPVYADRAATRGDVLAAGDNIRIRTSDVFRAGSQPSVETQVIDEEGYVTLPNVGRVKAAGLTPNQLASSVIPLGQAGARDSQSPSVHLTYSIEKIAPEASAIDQKFPATQQSGNILAGTSLSNKPEPGTGPTTHPTTGPTDLAAAVTAPAAGQQSGEQEKIDVVVIVQNVEGPTTAPALPMSEMPIERRAAEPVSPATQPAMTSPTTAPTTFPAR